MVQGTSSHAGKSVLAAALCRIFARDGCQVAPFKAQNMSLNSYVTPDGGEIGRSQAVQAAAAMVEPRVEMNPVLLKPEAEARSQVVVMGRPRAVQSAREYHTMKPAIWEEVTAALDALRAEYDVVVIEGAGSPAEINLKQSDIVNMRVALHARAPVLLVGDIDRGGVFAQLVGTMVLLDPEEQALVRGHVINKFRGDPSLLTSGLDFLEERTGVPIAGVIPWFSDIHVPEEDSLGLAPGLRSDDDTVIDVAVMRLPTSPTSTTSTHSATSPASVSATWAPLRRSAPPTSLSFPAARPPSTTSTGFARRASPTSWWLLAVPERR